VVWLRMDFSYSRHHTTHQLLGEGAAVNQDRIDYGWCDLWNNDLGGLLHAAVTPCSRVLDRWRRGHGLGQPPRAFCVKQPISVLAEVQGVPPTRAAYPR
jgi:hypothetical protein